MLDELTGFPRDVVNLNYRGDFMPGGLPEIGPIIDQPTAIETTFKIVKGHTAVERSVLRFYVDLTRVVTNEEARPV